VNIHTLNNGIRLVHLPDVSPVVYCGFAINAGTRDEYVHEHGMAHFVEHMLFKGTEKRKSRHIINCLESVGGELDAYTTKEETFIYAGVPTSFTERAIELLSDLVFHSVFPAKELSCELEVVLDEIQSYKDAPSELIYDDYEDILFANSSVGRNILGQESCLRQFTPAMLSDFVRRCYTTDQILFFATGEIPETKLIRWAEKYFQCPATRRSFTRETPPPVVPQIVLREKETFQTHCMLGNRAYPLGHEKRAALILLNNILGGPCMGSRLNLSIREKNGLAYTIDSSLSPYSDTGAWHIYFGCDNKNRRRCLELVHRELCQLAAHPLSERQLATAKRQFAGQFLIAAQNRENRILTVARSFLHLNRCTEMETKMLPERIACITAEELRQIAETIFRKEDLIQLTYH
jgi:predicted Zn-dependent peptidase